MFLCFRILSLLVDLCLSWFGGLTPVAWVFGLVVDLPVWWVVMLGFPFGFCWKLCLFMFPVVKFVRG